MSENRPKQTLWQRWLPSHVIETLAIDPRDHCPQVSQSRRASFNYALAGWMYMLRYQKNIRIQAAATVIVMGVALWLGLPARDLAVIVLMVGVVWLAEFVNAAIEAAVNLASPEFHPMARVAKDIAAGTVLFMVFISVIVGLLLLGPPLWEQLGLHT
ncbi:MAG: diacylglycerol kinase family protein [Chloroflexi bacterium]|nr:diacylglycerol kinase family protein [Chloroflexota bacterium]